MIDKDNSGTLEKPEIVKAVKEDKVANAASYDRAPFNLRGLLRDLRNCCFRVFGVWWCGIIQRPLHTSFPSQKVIKFLVNCGEPNLQNLLVPSRLEATLAVLDTDRDGHIDAVEWEACIESALANKLAERAARRELQAKAAQKEIEEFTAEFKSAARRCFQLIDKDGGGTLSHSEIVEAVKSDQEVISFLKTCGEENLMFLLHPPRLKKALEVLDTDGSGEVDVDEWETAINRGLAKRLEQMAKERERRERAAAAADEEFSAEFLTAARKVFQMIDDDDSGTLEKAEIVTAVRANREVIKFLTDCGNKNLQHLLVPSRLESALAQMDTDHDGTIDADEWEECIEKALANKLEQRAAAREAQSKAALKEIAEFTGEFLSAAQRCFELIDKDGGGTLSITLCGNQIPGVSRHGRDNTSQDHPTHWSMSTLARVRSSPPAPRTKKLSTSSPTAAKITSSSCSTRRACRKRSRSWTPTNRAKWTARSVPPRRLES